MNPDAPVADAGLPEPPENLSPLAAEKFRQLVRIIADMGIASSSDVHNLTVLAMRLEEVDVCTVAIEDGGRFFVSSVELDDQGRVVSQQIKGHPAVAQRSEAMRHAQSLLSEFGLSPAARSKVSATKKADENPFASFG
ncbi:P27 family phage terminase small subunit [Methylopila musalis]|uniref:P27 family phage terminase small subunit n=1 Tax=Methylopila musalis TaxID=1134781 RepID=A0ABW3Z3M7_9HYPH